MGASLQTGTNTSAWPTSSKHLEEALPDCHKDQNVLTLAHSSPFHAKEISWLVDWVESLELTFTNELLC